jgi:DNA polymerase elongation subunit (family B)
MVLLQPCDWIESDCNFKYVVDIFGRTSDNEVAKVRLTGFRPYFYLRACDGESASQISALLEEKSGKRLFGLKITQELKLDAMKGFNGLVGIKVWKLSCPALWMFKIISRTLKDNFKISGRKISIEDIYESNLPPYIRLFHELDICPASLVEFQAEDFEAPEDDNIDVYFILDYTELRPSSQPAIPLYACAYDIETYSSTGNFPVASNFEDEIIQIGLSLRWTDSLLDSVERYVLVSGTSTESNTDDLKIISCSNECELLKKFQDMSYIKCNKPNGAFYLFPSCKLCIGHKKPDGEVIQNDLDFCEYLLSEASVAVVPGSAFGMPNFFRLSYATSEELLIEACKRIANALNKLKP